MNVDGVEKPDGVDALTRIRQVGDVTDDGGQRVGRHEESCFFLELPHETLCRRLSEVNAATR